MCPYGQYPGGKQRPKYRITSVSGCANRQAVKHGSPGGTNVRRNGLVRRMTETGLANGERPSNNGVKESVSQGAPPRKNPLKRSASFTVKVDNVVVDPVIEYRDDKHEQDSAAEKEDEVIENIIAGTDWESVNYTVKQFACEDEVSGMDVSDDYIVAQYFLEPNIDVFDRTTLELLHHLEGHEYGGQAVQISGHLLFSGSKDCSLRSWDLVEGRQVASVKDHRDYVQCIKVKEVSVAGMGEDGRMTCVATGGAADHLVNVYKTDGGGKLVKRFGLSGHAGWVTCVEMTNSVVVSGSLDMTIRIYDIASGEFLQTLKQDAEITCLKDFHLLPGYMIFGDSESKLSLLDMSTGSTLHLMPNILVGTGRYRRSSKYHDKSVDTFHVTDNNYMITASSGSKFVKIWKLENFEDNVHKMDVTELQILRDHTDYLSVIKVHNDTVISSCGDGLIYLHNFPQGEQHYDMLRSEERNSVAVLYQGKDKGFAAAVDKSTIVCEGKLCKAGKSGLAKSSSSFQVSFALKPATTCLKMMLPTTIDEEDSEDSDEYEYEVEYVTDDDDDEDDESSTDA